MVSLIALPIEVLQQIIHYSTYHDLLQICRVHSSLYDTVALEIYHSIHFLDPRAKVPHEHEYLFDNDSSCAIKSLKSLIWSIENAMKLRTLITAVVLQWGHDLDGIVKSDILRLLRLIGRGLTRFHYAPPEWDLIIHRLYPVTSIYMPCPSTSHAIRQLINSMFSVPTLTNITLYHCERLSVYSLPTQTMDRELLSQGEIDQHVSDSVRISAVEHLSILHTMVDVEGTLAALMLLPKALKVFHCALGVSSEDLSKWALDPSVFVDVLAPQRATLQEISLDFINYTETYGTLGTTLRHFSDLRRMSMPHQFLVALPVEVVYGGLIDTVYDHLNCDTHDLYRALPPGLMDLVLNIDHDTAWNATTEFAPSQGLIRCLRDVAAKKQECYPRLQRVVLWSKWGIEKAKRNHKSTWGEKILNDLEFAFDQVGITLTCELSNTVPDFLNHRNET